MIGRRVDESAGLLVFWSKGLVSCVLCLVSCVLCLALPTVAYGEGGSPASCALPYHQLIIEHPLVIGLDDSLKLVLHNRL
jgi:hypothetical protein